MALHRARVELIFAIVAACLAGTDAAKYVSSSRGHLADRVQHEGLVESEASGSAAQTGQQIKEAGYQQQQQDHGQLIAGLLNFLKVSSPVFAQWLHGVIDHQSVVEIGFNDGYGNTPSFRFVPHQPGVGDSAGVFIRTDLARDAEPEYYDVFLVANPASDEHDAGQPRPISADDLVDVWFESRGEISQKRRPRSIRGTRGESDDVEEDELSDYDPEHGRKISPQPKHAMKHPMRVRTGSEHRPREPRHGTEKPHNAQLEDPVQMTRTPPPWNTGICETGVKVTACETPAEHGLEAMQGLQACNKEERAELEHVKICYG